MNVLILNGSPRKIGVTSKILNRMVEQLEKAHTVESIFVHDKSISPCTDCLGCRYDSRCGTFDH